mmetsp:Transcript_7749/g.17723  ORF Transcript_7749/g.17723 Transcript_7749/m.17723 type:complete len:337 (+) Transcript_7749:1-1011(+)
MIALTAQPSSALSDDSFGDSPQGISRAVRTSVVRGAQMIDKIDGKWERFSDDMGLGKARNQERRNLIDAGSNSIAKKIIKSEEDAGPFDEELSNLFLNACDETFVSNLEQTSSAALVERIERSEKLLRPSFFDSSPGSPGATKQEEFNFRCYLHFRSFNEILVKEQVQFPAFRRRFELDLQSRLIQIALKEHPSMLGNIPQPPSDLSDGLRSALDSTDRVANFLLSKGVISSWERSVPPPEDLEDFVSLATDCPFSLALYGDATLGSQLLLQELGFRLYPAFGRWMVTESITRCFAKEGGESVSLNVEDYYMDTSYNSNPDLFEVRQVLLNIALQR